MSAVQIVDDSDPVVSYSSGWQKSGGSNEYNATTSWTNQPGTTATVVFVGVQISVVGTIGPRTTGLVSPQSNYTVDGSTPNVYTATQDSTVHYNTRFYLSPVLPNGQHTLNVTNMLDSDSFFIDYFLIYKSSTDASFSPNVVTVTLTATPKSSANQTSGPSTANTGTIVGSALGAAVLVIVAVAFFLWLRSRNKRDPDELEVISSYRDEQQFTPAMVHTPPPSDTLRANQPVNTFASTSSDVAQPSATSAQTQSSTQDGLPPPPRYTLDFSQPLIPVRPSTDNLGRK